MTNSNFYCINCLNKVTLPRKRGRRRELGHLKKLWCIYCKQEVNHIEIYNEHVQEFEFNVKNNRQETLDYYLNT